MAAYWNGVGGKVDSKQMVIGGSINLSGSPFDIPDDDVQYSMNMDSKHYPAASVRPPRLPFKVGPSTAPTASFASNDIRGIGQRDDQALHFVDGNSWKYSTGDGLGGAGPATPNLVVLTTTLSTAATAYAEIKTFKTGTASYSVLLNGTDRRLWDGTSTNTTLTTDCPNSNLFAMHKGRMYVATGRTVKFCALNTITDWTTANDSGSIVITHAKGDITGICEFNDHIIVFTRNSMHELYGTGPLNYELVDIESNYGCIKSGSIVKNGGRLYWLSDKGICEYSGGTVVVISEQITPIIDIFFSERNIGDWYICSGFQSKYIYFGIRIASYSIGSGADWPYPCILKYDTAIRKWYLENGDFRGFTNIGGVLYGVDSTGGFFDMRKETWGVSAKYDKPNNLAYAWGDAASIPWEFVTKPYSEKTLYGLKTLTDLRVLATVSTDSTSFAVGYSTNEVSTLPTAIIDSTAFTSLLDFSSTGAGKNAQNTRIQIPYDKLQNTNWYRLRFSGTGHAMIHGMEKKYRIKRR